MCGRYRQGRDPGGVAEFFERVGIPFPNLPPSWNIAPRAQALVVRPSAEKGARHLGALRWGLVPPWSEDLKGGVRPINARAETVAAKPLFREAFAKRRCLVPADGYYEWRAQGGPKAPKQPYTIAAADGGPLAFAGLWEAWRSPADGEVVRNFAIITTEASEAVRELHDRMPVILPRGAWPAWLGEAPVAEGEFAATLDGSLAPSLAFWPVSPRVGRVSEDDAGLAEPHRLPG